MFAPVRYRTQVLVLVASVAVTCSAVVAWIGYRASRTLLQDTLMAQVRGLATAAAAMVDAKSHEQIRGHLRVDSPEYRRIEADLRRLRDVWRDAGLPVRFVYTLVPDPRARTGYVYMVDAEETGPDKSLPGDELDGGDPGFLPNATPRAKSAFARDQWGDALTGSAPILGADGQIVAVAGVDLPISSVKELDRSLAISGGAALLGAMVVALIAGWMLAIRITRPLERLRALAGTMADGELTTPFNAAGSREVAELSHNLESLRLALHAIVARIKEASVCSTASCATLNERTLAERDRARDAAANAVEAAGRAGDIVNTSRTLADAATELRTTSNAVVAAGTEGIENLRGIAAGVAQIRVTSAAVVAQLHSLRERAKAVDGLLEAMVSVADRSNLLSLNAEIEATKAGDAGRGFMVVASEIRRLAEQAAASSLQIEANVRRMHESVDEGVRATDQLVESLARGADRAQHGTDLLQTTISGIEGLAPRISSIADASVQQREGAEAISRALGGIAENATNALEFFESVDGLLHDLKERGTLMAEEVRRFRTA